MKKYELEEQLRSILNNGQKIAIKWDCGGDEALVYPAIDGKDLAYNDELSVALSDYLIMHLDLPSVGEYFVKGAGELRLNGDEIYIEHHSEANGYGYDYETETEYWVKNEKIDGDEFLFD
jgi:hypothetical protein